MGQTSHILIFAVALGLLLSGLQPAYAKSVPVPGRKVVTLENVESQLQNAREEKENLSRELRQKEKELESARKDLVSLTEKTRRNEEALDELGERIANLTAQEKDLTEKLESQYGDMSELVLALERIRRTPPEALIVRPGAPLEAAQSAMLLKGALPAIRKQADELSRDLNELQNIKEAIEKDRAAAAAEKEELTARRKEMDGLLAKREQYQKQISRALGEKETNIEDLAAQAKSLKDLVARIEEGQRQFSSSAKAKPANAVVASRAMPQQGTPHLPVIGPVITSFGSKDDIGAKSQGITIDAHPGASPVTPLGGIVRYAGSFKNYGKLVIIEHKDSYHSLIAGFERIDVNVGQAVKSGEPLGILPLTSSRGGRPALYYELRFKGNPVNPAEKLPDIRS